MPATKRSKQRDCILSYLMSVRSHPTADQIYLDARRVDGKISRGTVYRNLNRLVEAGRVRRVSIPGKADRFDHTLQNHAHAVCTVCGTVSDVLPQALPLLEEFLQQDCGFTVRRMNLVLEGVCPRCRQHTVS